MTPQQLAQTAQDLTLAERQLRAVGIILASLAHVLADALKVQASRTFKTHARKPRK